MNPRIVLSKKESIERCIAQIRLYKNLPVGPTIPDHLVEDGIESNLQKMAEQAIDIANYIIRSKKLGFPKESKDSFQILLNAGIIDQASANNMIGMVGFRNVLVHEYTKIDKKILADVVNNHLDDVLDFTNQVLRYLDSHP
jgi:uncharacterized protein YutE (UPF0331/DUF86 family)